MISRLQRTLVQIDEIADYIPIISTVTNLIDIVQKCLVIPMSSADSIRKSYYYSHLDQKSFARCLILCIPVIGNIIIGFLKTKVNTEIKTNADHIGSQGLKTSKHSAYSHESTIPSEYYANKYDIDQVRKDCPLSDQVKSLEGLNMDRGGIVERSDGTIAACLCDGVGGGGVFSMHAAQAFTDEALKYLQTKEARFYANNQSLGINLFNRLVTAPGPANDNNAGSATCVVATSRRLSDDEFEVHGAAIGDSVALHLDGTTFKITQLNVIGRKGNSAKDSGGQIQAGAGIVDPKKISEFSLKVRRGDIIILASDGLTDNVTSVELISTIVRKSFFDKKIQFTRDHRLLPSQEELSRYTDSPTISPDQVVTRLKNYVEWVTRYKRNFESDGYKTEAEREQLIKENGKELSSFEPNKELDFQELKILKKFYELKRLERALDVIKEVQDSKCGKTDDVMIMAFSPA